MLPKLAPALFLLGSLGAVALQAAAPSCQRPASLKLPDTAPDIIVAQRLATGKVDRTRPLCPHPQIAKYKGAGSADDAASFTCAVP